MRGHVSTSQAVVVDHRHGPYLIEKASQDFAAQTPQPIPDGCENSTGTTTNSESFRAAFPSLEARMSLIFGCMVKPAAGEIAHERAGAVADSRQRSPRRGRLRAGLCALLIAAAALVASPARGQSVTANVTDNNQPHGIAINPVTNKIYFADNSNPA